MKMKHDLKKENDFEPINFNIKIESEEELMTLWHCFNTGHMSEYFEDCRCDQPENFDNIQTELWNYIDNMKRERGIDNE